MIFIVKKGLNKKSRVFKGVVATCTKMTVKVHKVFLRRGLGRVKERQKKELKRKCFLILILLNRKVRVISPV